MKSFTTADSLTEIVFAHRNKSYGAYELRRMHNVRMQHAFLFTVIGLALLFFLLVKYSNINVTDVIAADSGEGMVTIAPPTIIPPKPTQQITPPPTRSTKGFTSNIIVSTVDTTTAFVDTATSHHAVSTGKGPLDGGDKKGGGTVAVVDSSLLDDNTTQLFVEIMPEFPGGVDALMAYLSKRIDCGSLWREQGESGNVVLSLVVGKDGSVSEVEVLRDGVGFGCAEQAMQVIRNMPKWKPGMQGNRPVKVKYILPVTYQKI